MSLLNEAIDAVVAGRTDPFLTDDSRRKFLAYARTLTGPDGALARALSARFHLMMFDRDGAVASLEPWLRTHDNKYVIDEAKLDELNHVPFRRGYVMSQLANLLYRTFRQFAEGLRQSELAEGLLCEKSAPNDDFLFLGLLENEVWRARLEWRSGRRADAERRVLSTITKLGDASLRNLDVGGYDQVSALAYDLAASFRWIQGHDAEQLALEAIRCMFASNASDPIRKAQVMFTAGKIASSEIGSLATLPAGSSLAKAIRYFKSACSEFERYEHPLAQRCRIRLAQSYVKADRKEAAEQELRKVHLKTIAAMEEEYYADAEYALTRIWLWEREAADADVPSNELWEKCEIECARILDLSPLPLRIEAEMKLHRGQAQIKLGKRHAGRYLVEQSLEAARKGKRVKIQIAAHLCLAESYIEVERNVPEAHRHWKDAAEALWHVRSSYLRNWCDRLAPRVGGPMLVEVKPHEKYADAEAAFRRAFLTYHWALSDYSMPPFCARSGVPRATASRWAKELKVDLSRPVSDRGGGTP